jgi:hypothetical protein
VGHSTAIGDEIDRRVVRSRLLPGGDLVTAVLNRQVMVLADRGGASGMVGRRWADVCAEAAGHFVGRSVAVPDSDPAPFVVERIARLDDVPRIAHVASKRGLQNPDLLFIGTRNGSPAIQAADAKFSVETARSKQVSPAVIEGLLGLGRFIDPLVGALPPSVNLLPGVFLSPDFPLTELMLKGRHGIVRATVKATEVIAIPVSPRAFFAPLECANLMSVLAEVDAWRFELKPASSPGSITFAWREPRSAAGRTR